MHIRDMRDMRKMGTTKPYGTPTRFGATLTPLQATSGCAPPPPLPATPPLCKHNFHLQAMHRAT